MACGLRALAALDVFVGATWNRTNWESTTREGARRMDHRKPAARRAASGRSVARKQHQVGIATGLIAVALEQDLHLVRRDVLTAAHVYHHLER